MAPPLFIISTAANQVMASQSPPKWQAGRSDTSDSNKLYRPLKGNLSWAIECTAAPNCMHTLMDGDVSGDKTEIKRHRFIRYTSTQIVPHNFNT